jgi:signal transduction histidine kinase/ligand-binding sensor domain-containing protein
MERGLPGQNVRQVYQDSKGIMWILVETVGVCRFDGRNFELFSSNPKDPESLSNNYVTAIIEDKNSNLWVATENGLNRYIRNTNKFEKYLADSVEKTGLTSNIILSLFIDRENNLWVGTESGLYKYNQSTNKFNYIKLISDDAHLWINCIIEHSSGAFFIGTNNGLISYNPISKDVKHWLPQTKSGNGLAHQYIRGIVEDNKGNLWLATHNGVSKYYIKSNKFELWHYLPEDAVVFENEGYNMAYTSDGKQIWLASYTSGVVVINSETNEYERISYELNTEHSLKSNHIQHIYKDRSGLLWISTKFEGLFFYDKRRELFNTLPEKYKIFEYFKNTHIISFSNDLRKEIFWVGTKFDGLYKIDLNHQTIKNYSHNINNDNSIGGNRIREIHCDIKGDLWIALGDGIDFLARNTNHFQHFSKTLGDCIAEDKNHTIWIGTTKGIFIANKEKKIIERYAGNTHSFFANDALNIMYMYNDKLGQLWFGTRYNGLFRYTLDSNLITHYSSKSSIRKFHSDGIRVITEDMHGNIWFGTKSGGVCIFNPQNDSVRYLTSADGLGSDYVLSIQQDLNHDFWIGTHNGLSKYDVKNKKFTNYTTVHGLQGNIFEFGTNAIFDDGYLIFGGYNGLNIFNPDQIDYKSLNKKDSILITSVKVFDKEILRDLVKNTAIELNYNQNYITLDFVLSDYVDPYHHNFSYRIKELSNNWFDLGNKNYVAFSNLEPGDYHIEIMGTNEFGLSNEKPLILYIHILPPFWQTWWFRSLIIITLVILLFLIVRVRTTRNRNQRLYLEAKILERTEELKDANEELITQNQLIETQKYEIEKNQDILEKKVQERTKDLELAKRKAEESDRLKSAFLANMSHEIRTPLNAIIGFSSIIVEETSDNEDFTDYGEHITKNADMLIKIIDDILDISKLEAGQLKVNKTEVNLNSLLKSVFDAFNQEITKKNNSQVELILKPPSEEKSERLIFTDSIRLKQIFYNLLSNALKFTFNGFIEFGYENLPDFIKFYVKDTGVGISKNDLSTIFNRFVKLESHDALYRGNGLGLSLCKSLTELLGGKMWVESQENVGSTFFFTISTKKEH